MTHRSLNRLFGAYPIILFLFLHNRQRSCWIWRSIRLQKRKDNRPVDLTPQGYYKITHTHTEIARWLHITYNILSFVIWQMAANCDIEVRMTTNGMDNHTARLHTMNLKQKHPRIIKIARESDRTKFSTHKITGH